MWASRRIQAGACDSKLLYVIVQGRVQNNAIKKRCIHFSKGCFPVKHSAAGEADLKQRCEICDGSIEFWPRLQGCIAAVFSWFSM